MNARYKKLRLETLQRQILNLTGRLETLTHAKRRAHHAPATETG